MFSDLTISTHFQKFNKILTNFGFLEMSTLIFHSLICYAPIKTRQPQTGNNGDCQMDNDMIQSPAVTVHVTFLETEHLPV